MIISFRFFGFLIFGAFFYWLIPKQKIRNIFLILVSLAFIGLCDKRAFLMVCILSLYSYGIAIWIVSKPKKNLPHRIGVSGLILFLVIFKYLGFLSDILSSFSHLLSHPLRFQIDTIVLPLGISYIVFKHISYLTDIYWGVTDKGSFFDFLLYSSLFTIFLAGPIERFERFSPQVSTGRKFHYSYLEDSFRRIVYGLFKKAVIADWIGYFISPVWEGNLPSGLGIRFLVLLGFSIRIYMDFSGYSDIAIGASKLFGIRIMENFDWPYLKPNINKFWRSWHISLSDWIRDYLFFPLSRISGNRIWLSLFVPVFSMALCGLWHGATWGFLLWGGIHGAGLAVHQLWVHLKKKHPMSSATKERRGYYVFGVLLNFLFVSFAWLVFK